MAIQLLFRPPKIIFLVFYIRQKMIVAFTTIRYVEKVEHVSSFQTLVDGLASVCMRFHENLSLATVSREMDRFCCTARVRLLLVISDHSRFAVRKPTLS
jgi:hypothetical protein